MSYTIAQKQNQLKIDLSTLKSSYITAVNGLLSTSPIPSLDTFNSSYLWGSAIMDLYAAYYAEMVIITGAATIPSTFNQTGWNTEFNNAVTGTNDCAFGQTSGLWIQGASALNTSSALLIQNGMTVPTNFGGSTSIGIAATAVVNSYVGVSVTATVTVGTGATTFLYQMEPIHFSVQHQQ